MSEPTFTGVRVFPDDERTPLVIGPEAVDGWTEETRQVEATALVLLLDPADYDAAVEDAGALLETEHAPAAVAILERLAVGGKPKAAQKLLAWLGEE
jgi:hypothetical protein